jgi:hypothetical protein
MRPAVAAVVYAPAGPGRRRWLADCTRLCQAAGWPVAAVTADPHTARWLLLTGQAGVVVVARPAHARAVWLAVVVVTDPPGRSGGDGRPRRLR